MVFDGSGVETLAAISDPTSLVHPLVTALRDNVHGACSFCASSHKVKDQLAAAGWPLLAETNGEASIRNLVAAGRQILSFQARAGILPPQGPRSSAAPAAASR